MFQSTIWVQGWNRDTTTARLLQPAGHAFHSIGLPIPSPTRTHIPGPVSGTTARHQIELSQLRRRLLARFHPPRQMLPRRHPVEPCHPTKSQSHLPCAEKTRREICLPRKRHEENGARPIPANHENGRNHLRHSEAWPDTRLERTAVDYLQVALRGGVVSHGEAASSYLQSIGKTAPGTTALLQPRPYRPLFRSEVCTNLR